MNKKASSTGIIIVLILFGVGYYFFIYQNGANNPFKNYQSGTNPTSTSSPNYQQYKLRCEQSGGTYNPTYSTKYQMTFYSCLCISAGLQDEPSSQYCVPLTSSDYTACSEIASNGWNCMIDQYNYCTCTKPNFSTSHFSSVKSYVCQCKDTCCRCDNSQNDLNKNLATC